VSDALEIPGKEETLRALSDYFTRFCAGTDFLRRLASENRWDEAHAYRVVAEYIRFLAIAKLSGEAVAPSDAVDKAWHLHLVYTHWYWEELCGKILGKPFHHFPANSSESRKKFSKDARRTLELYEGYFGRWPEDIWGKPSRWRALDRLNLLSSLLVTGLGATVFLGARQGRDGNAESGVFMLIGGVVGFLGICYLLSVLVDWAMGRIKTRGCPPGYALSGADFVSYPSFDSGGPAPISAGGGGDCGSGGHGGHHGAHGGHDGGGGHGSCGTSCGSSCGGGCGGGGGD